MENNTENLSTTDALHWNKGELYHEDSTRTLASYLKFVTSESSERQMTDGKIGKEIWEKIR